MDVQVNRRGLEVPGLSGLTLRGLLEQVRHLEERQGRVLVRIEVDGRPITLQDPHGDLDKPATQFGRVEILSDQPQALAGRVLRETAAHLPALAGFLRQASSCLREGRHQEAAQVIEQSLPFWSTVQKVVEQSAALTRTDLALVHVGQRAVRGHLEQLVAQLTQLKDAYQQRDLVLVADLLEYELSPLAEQWETVLTHLADHIAGQA